LTWDFSELRMHQDAPGRPREGRERKMRRIIVIAAVAAAAVAAGIWRPWGGGSSDYRDPVQLAQAVKDKEQGASASCAKLSGATYICSVAKPGLVMGTYQVTVAADGKSYTVS
jgi:hypothetical protein